VAPVVPAPAPAPAAVDSDKHALLQDAALSAGPTSHALLDMDVDKDEPSAPVVAPAALARKLPVHASPSLRRAACGFFHSAARATAYTLPPSGVHLYPSADFLPVPAMLSMPLKEAILQSYLRDTKLRDPTFESQFRMDVDGLHRTSSSRYYVPDQLSLCHAVLHGAHDAVHAAHHAVPKTFDRASRLFLWPAVCSDAATYVSYCDSCHRNMSLNMKPAGHLQPFCVIMLRKFQAIPMELIVKFPKLSVPHPSTFSWSLLTSLPVRSLLTSLSVLSHVVSLPKPLLRWTPPIGFLTLVYLIRLSLIEVVISTAP
jgi:hypothetical protein